MSNEVSKQSKSEVRAIDSNQSVLSPVMVALEKGLDITVIEKMIELQYAQEDRQAEKAFNQAMSAFQSEIPVIEKSGIASFPTKNGGRMEYQFTKIEDISKAVKPLLSKNNLSYRFEGKQEGSLISITCIVSHSDGHSASATMTAGADATGNKNAVQQIASTRTYLKRYTMTEALGIIVGGEDDDASTTIEEKIISGDFYPQADFDQNFPNWKKQIIDGKSTAEKIVSFMNNKKVVFSEDQLTAIYGVKA